MIELLDKGGWIMYVIFTLSVISGGIAIERSLFFLMTRDSLDRITDYLKSVLNDMINPADHIDNSFYLKKLALVYADNKNLPPEKLEEAMHQAGSEEIKKMEKRLSVLYAIGSLAPLLGLLGTVLGMIECFRKISTMGGMADAEILAGGIWEALLTTAFGLMVAIPVLAAYHFFEHIVDDRNDFMHSLATEIMKNH